MNHTESQRYSEMSTLKLLLKNIALTITTAAVCALFGFVLSFPIGLLTHGSDVMFDPGRHGVSPDLARDFEHLQKAAGFCGGFIGILAAQSVFLIMHLRSTNEHRRNAS